ncbi:MAG: hypothetical protein AAF530_24600 [Pseudomonadota bacterium]
MLYRLSKVLVVGIASLFLYACPTTPKGEYNLLESQFVSEMSTIRTKAEGLAGVAKEKFQGDETKLLEAKVEYIGALSEGRGLVDGVAFEIISGNKDLTGEFLEDKVENLKNQVNDLNATVNGDDTSSVNLVVVQKVIDLAVSLVSEIVEFYDEFGEKAKQHRIAKAEELEKRLVWKDWDEI